MNLVLILSFVVTSLYAASNQVQRLKVSSDSTSTDSVKVESSYLKNQRNAVSYGFQKHAFDHKVFFVERPSEMNAGEVSYRNHNIFIHELSLDLRFFRVDWLRGGLDVGEVADNFDLITLSSPQFQPSWFEGLYSVSAGVKYFQQSYQKETSEFSTDKESSQSRSFYLNQSYAWRPNTEVGAFVSVGGEEETADVMWVPWAQGQIHGGWHWALEYYYTNTKTLPLRSIQYGLDADMLEFYNPERAWFSWMNYGVKYVGEDIYFGLSLMNHFSFQFPFIPVIGVGYEF